MRAFHGAGSSGASLPPAARHITVVRPFSSGSVSCHQMSPPAMAGNPSPRLPPATSAAVIGDSHSP